jgi:hypothetical protein
MEPIVLDRATRRALNRRYQRRRRAEASEFNRLDNQNRFLYRLYWHIHDNMADTWLADPPRKSVCRGMNVWTMLVQRRACELCFHHLRLATRGCVVCTAVVFDSPSKVLDPAFDCEDLPGQVSVRTMVEALRQVL